MKDKRETPAEFWKGVILSDESQFNVLDLMERKTLGESRILILKQKQLRQKKMSNTPVDM